MGNSNVRQTENEKKLNRIYSILIFTGVVTTVCLVFFFTVLFRRQSQFSEAKIFSAQQLGSTDTSLLVSWSSSESSTGFEIICCETADGQEVARLKTDQPFAAVHGLLPYHNYKVAIVPFDANGGHEPYVLRCRTSPYCNVTEVSIEEVDGGSATVSWKYEGMDAGFTVVAYALDRDSRRHLTSRPVSVSPGAEQQCRLTGLLSELNYTVCVMPETRYAKVGKSTFTTDRNYEPYKELSVIRFVVCGYDSANTFMVHATNQLTASAKYKTSMIVSGKAEKKEDIPLTVYLTDTDGNLVSEYVRESLLADPDGAEPSDQINYRPIMTEFTAPDPAGDYRILAAFDGVTVGRFHFSVVE